MASSSPFLKLVSCGDKNLQGFLCFKDDGKLLLNHSPFSHRNTFKLSISLSRGVRPLSISSSHTQAKVDNDELLIQESPNGYSTEVEIQTVSVQFQLQRECSFGQKFMITGDHPILGLWDPNNAISLNWSDGHIWTVDLDIPVGECINFKFVMQESNGKFVWQPGPDRTLECFQTKKIITLCEDWENPDSRKIIETDPIVNQSEDAVTQVPDGYMTEVLVSDEVVPVLVPGLSQLMVNEGPNDEPEPVNVVSTESDMANGLTLPELNESELISWKGNLNPRPQSEINENEEKKHQEMKEEEANQPITSLLHNDIEWSNNVMQKFLNIFGIQ